MTWPGQAATRLLHDDHVVAAVALAHAILHEEVQVALILGVGVGESVHDQRVSGSRQRHPQRSEAAVLTHVARDTQSQVRDTPEACAGLSHVRLALFMGDLACRLWSQAAEPAWPHLAGQRSETATKPARTTQLHSSKEPTCERLYDEAELSLSKELLWRSGGGLAAGAAHASGSGRDGLAKLRGHTMLSQRCHDT